jgi:hypothetical protein
MAGMEPPTMLRLSSRTHHIRARTVLSGVWVLVDGTCLVPKVVSGLRVRSVLFNRTFRLCRRMMLTTQTL